MSVFIKRYLTPGMSTDLRPCLLNHCWVAFNMQRIGFCQQNRKTSPPRQKVCLFGTNSMERTVQETRCSRNGPILCSKTTTYFCVSVSTEDILMTRIKTFQAVHNNAYKLFFQASIAGFCLWQTNWIKLVQSILREEYANHAICFSLWDSKKNWIKGRGRIGCWLNPSLGLFPVWFSWLLVIFIFSCQLFCQLKHRLWLFFSAGPLNASKITLE